MTSNHKWKTTFRALYLSGVLPLQHKTVLCRHTQTTVWVIWPQITTGTHLSEPHVYQGFSLHSTNNNYVDTQPLCGLIHLNLHYWNSTIRTPCLSGVLPPQHKQQLCRRKQPLCGLIHLKLEMENNIQGPMFIRVNPPQHKKTTLWTRTTTAWVYSPQITTKNNIQGPMFIRGSPSTT